MGIGERTAGAASPVLSESARAPRCGNGQRWISAISRSGIAIARYAGQNTFSRQASTYPWCCGSSKPAQGGSRKAQASRRARRKKKTGPRKFRLLPFPTLTALPGDAAAADPLIQR